MRIMKVIKLVLLLCGFMGLTQPKYFIFEEKGKSGLVNLQGKTVLAPTFDSIKQKRPYIIACGKTRGCWVYNKNLRPILKGAYNSTRFGCKGQFIVEKNGKYGIVSEKGTIILPLKYSFVNSNKNGHTMTLDDKAGLSNSEGKEIIPISYRWIYTDEVNDNIPIVARLNGREGYINTRNEWVIPATYRGTSAFRQGLVKVMEVRNYIYINLKGEPVIQDFDTNVIEPSDNTYIVGVRKGCEYTVYDLNGDLLDTYDGFVNNWGGNGIFEVKKGGKWGYIDGYDKVIIPLEYEEVGNSSKGLVAVRKDGKWKYINLKNEVVIPFKFANRGVGSFKSGIARYYTGSGIGLINLKGEIIAEPKYNNIQYLRGNVAIVSFDDCYHLYNFVKKRKLKRLEEIRIEKALITDEPGCS